MQLIGEDLALSHLGESMFARFNVVLTLSAQFIVPSIFATTAVAGPEGVSITGPDPVSFSKFIKAHGQECHTGLQRNVAFRQRLEPGPPVGFVSIARPIRRRS
jgi:hypothetical protein